MKPCEACNAELPDGAVACAQCGSLVHGDLLKRLYGESRQAESRGDHAGALALLEACLERLPPGSRQYSQVANEVRRVEAVRAQTRLRRAAVEARERLHPVVRPRLDRWAIAGICARVCGSGVASVPGLSHVLTFVITAGSVAWIALRVGLTGLTQRRTLTSMALWIVSFSLLMGWERAAVFGLLVYLHEAGHIVALEYLGVGFSWPFFVPFVGAYVMPGRGMSRRSDQALVSLGGPALGMVPSFVVLCLARSWDIPAFWTEAARLNLMLNLANLAPLPRLDGERLTCLYDGPQLVAIGGAVLVAVWALRANVLGLVLGGAYLLRLLFPRRPPAGGDAGEAAGWVLWALAVCHAGLAVLALALV